MLDGVGLADEQEKADRRLLAQPQLTAAELGTRAVPAERAVPPLMSEFWAARHADSRNFVDVVTDQDSIMDRWYQLQRATRYEVRGFDCPPYFAERGVRWSGPG
jgi:hypothetical protein